MRRADEDHARHERQRFDEHRVLQKLPGLRGHGRGVEGLVAERLLQKRSPESMAVSLVRSPPVLWPMTTIWWSAGSGPITLACRHARRQHPPQAVAGIEDRVSGVVGEEPELVAGTDAGVLKEIVHHVHPAEGTGGRPVDEDDRYPARVYGWKARSSIGCGLSASASPRNAASSASHGRAATSVLARTAVGSASSGMVRSPMRIDSSLVVAWTSSVPSSVGVTSCWRGWSMRSTAVTGTRMFGPTRCLGAVGPAAR